MYDKGLPSLPDDIVYEIFSLLDLRTLKSCSLTGKALSYLVKPFIHRTLHLTRWNCGHWSEFLQGLPILGKRGLLQHTRHILIVHPYGRLYAWGFDLHIQHLRTLTNLRSLKARGLDIPSFIPKVEGYFGAFFGTLQSLELESPVGDHKQILYFACQFPNLRDLKITNIGSDPNSVYNGGHHFDIKTSPPFDGTLDLQWDVNLESERGSMGPHLILSDLIALPSGCNFQTLKLSECVGGNLQLLVDACAPTLECMAFTGGQFGASFLHGGECPRTHLFILFNYQAPQNILNSVSNVTLRYETLKST